MKEKLRMLFDEKLWKFLLVGVLNTLVGNGLMFLLYNLAGFSYWPATGLSYALASVMSYFLNRYFTFKYQGSGWETALRFALNIAVCYGLAYGLAKPLVRLIFSGLSKKWAENLAMLAAWASLWCSTTSASAFLPSARRRRSKERWWREPADSRAFPPAARVM